QRTQERFLVRAYHTTHPPFSCLSAVRPTGFESTQASSTGARIAGLETISSAFGFEGPASPPATQAAAAPPKPKKAPTPNPPAAHQFQLNQPVGSTKEFGWLRTYRARLRSPAE